MTDLLLIPFAFLAGFVDAVAGGGGLISLPAVLALGLPPTLALGTNKVIGSASVVASSFRYWRAGEIKKIALPLAAIAGLCSVAGALTATWIRPAVLRPVILGLLIAVGLYTVSQRRFGLAEETPPPGRGKWIWGVTAAIGFYDGFFGPGTGTFTMIAFVLLLGWPLLGSSGNARLVNLASNLGALLLFAAHRQVAWRMALPGALAALCGGMAGAGWAVKNGSRGIRPVFIAVTWFLIAKVIWDLLRRR